MEFLVILTISYTISGITTHYISGIDAYFNCAVTPYYLPIKGR